VGLEREGGLEEGRAGGGGIDLLVFFLPSHIPTHTGLCILSAYLVKAFKFYYLPE
jgi:hypothetical protein